MPTTCEQAKRGIAGLIEKYERLGSRTIRAYNEANTCKDFILPLFRVLGWDISSSEEISAERKVSRGRVDYAFRLGGIPKFFLEAKKFTVDLNDPRWARQAINYAWIKGVTWAVLTDFEGLKVFNAEWKEANPLRNIFIDLTYNQYLDEFDRLWLLSKEATCEGRIDQEALRVGKKLKKRPIDEQLLGEFVQWRELLHRYLSKYNPHFSDDQIDEAVQRILDRLIFIRTCEDRGIEAPTLRPLLREWRDGGRRKDLVKLLSGVFRDFDQGYDARLFAPHFSEKLSCEPNPFEEVIGGLYATKDGVIEYDFNAIDVDVLGGIYEQYLGYVAKVVERREKREEPLTVEVIERKGWRKKHGIYYTPQFVVRYIVANTLGKLLEERSYNEVRQLKVLDPACGSGSFLIEAFDVLDKYHRRVKGEDRAGVDEGVQADFLDYAQRLQILTSNIYGVDLDAQAVEIARLNLLLKTLTQRAQLPDLADNIRQGNSLISGTPEELRGYFGENWEEKRPFNWEEEFPKVMERGGFDVIVGNPPYFNIETWGKHSPDAEWIKANFPETWMDKSDILFYFITRGIQLLRGRLGFIVSRAFLEAAKAKRLREFILKHCAIETVIDFRNHQVFEDASIATAIIILRRETNAKIRQQTQIQVVQVRTWSDSGDALMARIESQIESGESYSGDDFCNFMYPQSQLDLQAWVFAPIELDEMWRRIDDGHPTLGEVCEIGEGMQTGANKVFQVNEYTIEHSHLEKKWLRKRAANSDVRRYHIEHSGGWLIYVEDVASFSECPPNIAEYLKINRRRLEARAAYQRGNCEWFKFTWPLHKEWYTRPKLIVPYRAAENRFALDEAAEYIGLTDTTNVFKRPDDQHDLKYYLGLLNSRLLTFRFQGIAKMTGSGMYEYFENSIRRLPIRRIDFDNPEEKEIHDDLVVLVERMLELNKRLKDAVGREREELERKIKRTDAEIDGLVYRLYELTEEEIGVVERQS